MTQWLKRAKFWLVGGVIGALLLLIARVVWHVTLAALLVWLAETIERFGPATGTAISLVLMWHRAGKKQVNGLAARLKRQEEELDEVRAKLEHCEGARRLLLEQNLDLLQRGLNAFPPPGVDEGV